MNSKDFISIVIPALNRFDYLKTVIDSIHEYADYPFEIIVHDDASNREVTHKIIDELLDKISTYALNPNIGYNLGLSESVDRCVKLATSNYILMLNADCKVTGKCFKRLADALDNEFVGYITPHEDTDLHSYFMNNGTRFALVNGLGGGCVCAFRKSVWREVGGWAGNDTIWSGGADTNFFGKVYSKGYFRASIDGKNCFYNMSLLDKGNSDTTINGSVVDCSFPKVFGSIAGRTIEDLSRERYGRIDHEKHRIEKIAGSSNNSQYWHTITTEFNHFPDIDWEKAAFYGFGRFKQQILEQQLFKKED